MSDCSNSKAYYEPLRVTVNFKDGLRPYRMVMNKLTPDGERHVASFEVGGVTYLPAEGQDTSECEVTG